MKLRKKNNTSEESYWQSFTDIMAGLLLVILLVLMLLLLLLSQMKDQEHSSDEQYATTYTYNDADDYYNDNHSYDHEHDFDNEYSEAGGGGGGEGEDDPGTNDNEGIYVDIGHDKTAVFVTVVDKETGNVIKKDGILFELYADSFTKGGLLALHTYYPKKIEYRQYETTKDGTFYLPEKISQGIYSLHNLTAPTGYGPADDVEFNIDESLDWSEPYMVEVPMEPSKGIIYVNNVDSKTNIGIADTKYAVYADEDVVTLDGTVRYKAGEKVDEFECDKEGRGESKKLYFGNYTVKQEAPSKYYALNSEPLSVKLDYYPEQTKSYTFLCTKTAAKILLTDEYNEQAIEGAVYTVTDKEDEYKTDEKGYITITDLEKNKNYTVTLMSVPDPYSFKESTVKFDVDVNGRIEGEAVNEFSQTAYIVRLNIEVSDLIFKNSVTGNKLKLYDSSDAVVDEWEATGGEHTIEGLKPGLYSLEIDGSKSSSNVIDLKDNGKLQTLSTAIWTLWDTIATAAAALFVVLIIIIAINIFRRIRKKKGNEQQ